MYHIMQPRKILRLEHKKKPDASSSPQKSFRIQCNTFSGYGHKQTNAYLFKPRSMTFSASPSLHRRESHDRRNFARRGHKCCVDSFHVSTLFGKNLKRNGPFDQNIEDGITSKSDDVHNVTCKINVIGSPKVGKTSLIQRLKRRQWNPDFPACGDDVCKQKVQVRVDDKVVRLVFHETDLRMQRDIPHQDSDAFLLVYSLEDRRTLSTAAKILRQMRNKYKVTSPIFLIANKLDLVGKVSISKDDGKLLEKEFKCKYMETSLLHQTDFHELFLDIIRNILVKDEFYYDEESIFELDSLPANKKKIKGPMFRFLSSIFKCCSK